MAVIVEAYRNQHRSTWLHNEKLFIAKILYLVIVASLILYPDPLILLLFALVGVSLLASIKSFQLIIYSLLVYIPPAAIILLIDCIAGTLIPRVVYTLLYGYTSFINILLVYSTTPIQQIYRYMGRNPLTLSLLMIHNVVAELWEVIESKKTRGWEPGWNPFNHFLIVFEALRIVILRLDAITIAFKARGAE